MYQAAQNEILHLIFRNNWADFQASEHFTAYQNAQLGYFSNGKQRTDLELLMLNPLRSFLIAQYICGPGLIELVF